MYFIKRVLEAQNVNKAFSKLIPKVNDIYIFSFITINNNDRHKTYVLKHNKT